MTQDTMSVMADAEIRAKTLLSHIMGKKIYNKFTRDGKIEIKSGKYKYLLYKDGTIINKTMMKSYCIRTDSTFYPLSDKIAIKYCWIKYGNWTVERVAYKSGLSYSEIIERGIYDKGLFSEMDTFLMALIIITVMALALLIYVIIDTTHMIINTT